MAGIPSRAIKFSSAVGDDAVAFGDRIRIAPGLGKEAGGSMSAYSAFFHTGARADLPADYAEVWVVLSGALRLRDGSNAMTVRAGEFVLVPEQTPGIVEALEDTTMVCVSVPAH